jgi:hypothetical protein
LSFNSLKAIEQIQLDRLTNAAIIDAIRFAFNRAKEDLKSSVSNSNEDDKEESNELDYNEDRDQLEGKKKSKLGK